MKQYIIAHPRQQPDHVKRMLAEPQVARPAPAPPAGGPLMVAVKPHEGQVLLDFGQTISWVMFSPEASLKLAKDIETAARQVLGQIRAIPARQPDADG